MLDFRNARLIEELGTTEAGAQFLMEIAASIDNFSTEVREALVRIENKLTSIDANTVEPERLDDAQYEGLIRRVLVSTAGTAVQGPSITVPKGFDTVIRMRRHTGTPNGYVALSEHNVSSTGMRSELQDNDSLSLKVSNWSKIWFDADTNSTAFELIAER